jgi:protein-disulfide isomerase
MEEEKKGHEAEHNSQESSKKHNITAKVRENPWMLSTIICGAFVLVLLIATFSGGITGKVISANNAGEKLISFYKTMGVENLTYVSVKEVSGVYQVNVNYQGQEIPLYITKDGKNIITSLNSIEEASETTENTETTEIPKSAKPSVELYVFTYCPYGTQMEKAILPAIKLLGDKIDFKIRQIGAMHGEHEKLEAERQLCIEKNYPAQFLDYVLAFAESSAIGNCNGDATCLLPELNKLYAKFGIDASKINACITKEGETMYNAEVNNANSKGVSGSPTLIINGVTSSAARNAEAIKGVICSAFTDVPSACSTTLSTNSPSAGFGSSTTTSSSSASC